MGYDLHVVLTDQWTDSESRPITKADIDRLIASDSELSWSKTEYVEMTEPDGSVARYFLINWRGTPTFWWYRSEIICKNPDEAQVLKLVAIAEALGARVVGDDGERYERGKSIFGRSKVVIRRE